MLQNIFDTWLTSDWGGQVCQVCLFLCSQTAIHLSPSLQRVHTGTDGLLSLLRPNPCTDLFLLPDLGLSWSLKSINLSQAAAGAVSWAQQVLSDFLPRPPSLQTGGGVRVEAVFALGTQMWQIDTHLWVRSDTSWQKTPDVNLGRWKQQSLQAPLQNDNLFFLFFTV